MPSNRILSASGLNLVGLGLPAFLALWTIPRLIHGLGGSGYALFALAWGVLGYLTLFDLGIGRAVSRHVAMARHHDRPAEVRAHIRHGIVSQSIFGSLIAGMAMLATPAMVTRFNVILAPHDTLVPSLRWLAITLPLVLIGAVLQGALEGIGAFVRLNVARVASSTVLLLLPVFAVDWGGDVLSAIAALTVARSIGVGVTAALLVTALPSAPRTGGSRPWFDLYRFGGWITVSGIANPLLTQSDRFVIQQALGAVAVTQYTAPLDVITRLAIFPTSLVGALFPRFVALHAAGDLEALRHLVRIWTVRLAVGMGGVIAILIAATPALLQAWIGPAMSGAALPARWLLCATWVNAIAWVPTIYLLAIGRPDLPAKSHIIQVPAYLTLTMALTAQWGLLGAALATLARVTIDTAVLFALCWRATPRPIETS